MLAAFWAKSAIDPAVSLTTVWGLKSRFLEGLARPDVESILAPASHRWLLANSVVVNQGDSADRLFLLTKGRARYFFITQEGRNLLLFWLRPGDIFGGAALLAKAPSYLVQRRNGER